MHIHHHLPPGVLRGYIYRLGVIALMSIFSTPAAGAEPTITRRDAELMADKYAPLLDAIQEVETGGIRDPANACGDSGLAVGWLQMWPAVHKDCLGLAPWLPSYMTCARDKRLARLVAVIYWTKYQAHDDKERALIWHYGPSGRVGRSAYQVDRHRYWPKVQARMGAKAH